MLTNPSTPAAALTHVHTRSWDLGEARPELGHATNAAVILGRRELTKGGFFARRAFLFSYDPHSDDDKGTNLERCIFGIPIGTVRADSGGPKFATTAKKHGASGVWA